MLDDSIQYFCDSLLQRGHKNCRIADKLD